MTRGKPAAVEYGDDDCGVKIEYVNSRGRIRVTVWRGDDQVDRGEMTLEDFIQRLDVDVPCPWCGHGLSPRWVREKRRNV